MVYLKELLLLFFKSEQDWLSGTFLAKNLGVSRVSIGNFINQLEEDGFAFEALRGKGYRMVEEPSQIQEHWLKVQFESLTGKDFPIWVFPEIDSTNQEAERQFANGRKGPFAIIANRQTKGRGRLGSIWQSQQSQNLYMSLGWQPRVSPENMPQFTIFMALSIACFLRKTYQLPIMVKWPNDLILLDKKVAGILVEARMETAYIHHLVFGLGLNINGTANEFPEKVKNQSISIQQFNKKPVPIHSFTVKLLQNLLQSAEQFLNFGILQNLIDQWDSYDYLKGKSVVIDQVKNTVTGVASGITPNGQLKIKTKSGIKLINTGSIIL